MTNLLETIKKYYEETPSNKISEDWEKTKEWDSVGPPIEDFFNCDFFDNSKIDLVHQIRKQKGWGICAIKVALIKSNYNLEDAIKILSSNSQTIA